MVQVPGDRSAAALVRQTGVGLAPQADGHSSWVSMAAIALSRAWAECMIAGQVRGRAVMALLVACSRCGYARKKGPGGLALLRRAASWRSLTVWVSKWLPQPIPVMASTFHNRAPSLTK